MVHSGLTLVVPVKLGTCLLAVGTRLVCAIRLYAVSTEQFSTLLMLSRFSGYGQADKTLQSGVGLREKVTIVASSHVKKSWKRVASC